MGKTHLRELFDGLPFGERPLTSDKLKKLYVPRKEEDIFRALLHSSTMIYLTGPRGIGKSTFAVHLATTYGQEVHYVPLMPREGVDMEEGVFRSMEEGLARSTPAVFPPRQFEQIQQALRTRALPALAGALAGTVQIFDGPPAITESKQELAKLASLAERMQAYANGGAPVNVVLIGSEAVDHRDLGRFDELRLGPFTPDQVVDLLNRRLLAVWRGDKPIARVFRPTFFTASARAAGGFPEQAVFLMNHFLKTRWNDPVKDGFGEPDVWRVLLDYLMPQLSALTYTILKLSVDKIAAGDASGITSADVQREEDAVPDRTIRYKLKELVSADVLKMTGVGRERYYQLIRLPLTFKANGSLVALL